MPFTLPNKQDTRTCNLVVRLTAREKAALQALAQEQEITCSALARHFLSQALEYCEKAKQEARIGPHQEHF